MFYENVHLSHWQVSSTTNSSNQSTQFFIVTHPFHPLRGKQFELVYLKQTWGELRVFYYDSSNTIQSLPACWTDAIAVDPFVDAAQGNSYFRINDLVEMVELISGVNAILQQV